MQGKDAIMVIIDKLSKYAHFLVLGHPFTVKDVAEVFIKEIGRLHSFPATIVSDRDKIFLGQFWTELFKQVGTQVQFRIPSPNRWTNGGN